MPRWFPNPNCDIRQCKKKKHEGNVQIFNGDVRKVQRNKAPTVTKRTCGRQINVTLMRDLECCTLLQPIGAKKSLGEYMVGRRPDCLKRVGEPSHYELK